MEEERSKQKIKEYYQFSLNAQKELEKRNAQIVAVAEIMEWDAEKVNEILGSNVMLDKEKEKV